MRNSSSSSSSTHNDNAYTLRWYNSYNIEQMTFTFPRKSKVYRAILEGEMTLQTFHKNVESMSLLTGRLRAPILFICVEPGEINTQHFIFGAIFNRKLLIINPIGISRHRGLRSAMTQIQSLNGWQVYQSHTVIQQDECALENCGPICIELMHHFSQHGAELLHRIFVDKNNLTAAQTIQSIDLAALQCLPDSLSGVPLPEYYQRMESIRAKHYALAKRDVGVSPEQAIVFQWSHDDQYKPADPYFMRELKAARDKLEEEYKSRSTPTEKYQAHYVHPTDSPPIIPHQALPSSQQPPMVRDNRDANLPAKTPAWKYGAALALIIVGLTIATLGGVLAIALAAMSYAALAMIGGGLSLFTGASIFYAHRLNKDQQTTLQASAQRANQSATGVEPQTAARAHVAATANPRPLKGAMPECANAPSHFGSRRAYSPLLFGPKSPSNDNVAADLGDIKTESPHP